ncbi:MAG: hypothetical protein Tp1137MES00d2C23059491_17 [Prokaryotic dsDNA virus sp.]|nr:MAG: hypothetical protein Tp1137MES00d2C23059491_17 [Prokaryotic dsDNA virus sp.]|tara:strand:+ start:8440 stop:8658 length:219 start_codon:yes stop_codon:yes gene_type:complete
MINKDLINKCESHVEIGELPNDLATELLSNYKILIEQNAELHKELAKLKGDRVFVVNEGKPYSENPPNNLAM